MITRRRLLAGGALAAAVAVGAVVMLAGGGAAQTDAASQSTATTTIRQQDLVERETVDGTLGYSDARTVRNRLSGTVTRTPAVGSVVRTNHRLYEVDGEPVFLLDGTFPAYRTMQSGVSGDDVLQFERNMRAFDLDPAGAMTVDGTWDAGTTAAAKRWQARKGLDADGTIQRGRIVFAPGSRRVSEIVLPAGASASGGGGSSDTSAGGGNASGAGGSTAAADVSSELMTTTSTKRIVTVDLVTTKQALAEQGAAVVVEMPNRKTVKGKIARVGKVAERKATAQNEDPPATIELVITLTGSTGTGLDQAPVDVSLEKSRAKDALTVPVTALLARAGGAFAVEVRDAGHRRIVPVRTGLYTDSFVEISGDGLRPGMTVTNSAI